VESRPEGKKLAALVTSVNNFLSSFLVEDIAQNVKGGSGYAAIAQTLYFRTSQEFLDHYLRKKSNESIPGDLRVKKPS